MTSRYYLILEYVLPGIILFSLAPASSTRSADPMPRFGWEWNETVYSNTLLEILTGATGAQQTYVDINVNALGGGWNGMQASEGAALNFQGTDKWVEFFQEYGFALAWNVCSNAPWSYIDNADCIRRPNVQSVCAPDAQHWDDWYDYIYAVVERYDGDGVDDMPGLVVPVTSYIMIGEVIWGGTHGDDTLFEGKGFWNDSWQNLLQLHKVAYQAMRDADGTGRCKLISSGGVFWDFFNDFPEYPAFDYENEESLIYRRLTGENIYNSQYIQSWEYMKLFLDGLRDPSNGPFCDYIGWHPHLGWRGIEQAFAFIRAYAGNYPIYVDDMWCNIFSCYGGYAVFINDPMLIEGDFPNDVVTGYWDMYVKLHASDETVTTWYYAKHARRVCKSFISVFGEGAITATMSGTNDLQFFRDVPLFAMAGWINPIGTSAEAYFLKAGYYTYKLLVDTLHDFTLATEMSVSVSPFTRCYRFVTPRGDVYVMWSETGESPEYREDCVPWTRPIPNGETIELDLQRKKAHLTSIIAEPGVTQPETVEYPLMNGIFRMQLGFEPLFVEIPSVAAMLYLNSSMYHGGDQFLLTAILDNKGERTTGDLYIVLDVYNNYWFWDSWSQEFDFEPVTLEAGERKNLTILDFDWPANAGAAEGIRFWGALIDSAKLEVIGDYDMVEFGYE